MPVILTRLRSSKLKMVLRTSSVRVILFASEQVVLFVVKSDATLDFMTQIRIAHLQRQEETKILLHPQGVTLRVLLIHRLDALVVSTFPVVIQMLALPNGVALVIYVLVHFVGVANVQALTIVPQNCNSGTLTLLLDNLLTELKLLLRLSHPCLILPTIPQTRIGQRCGATGVHLLLPAPLPISVIFGRQCCYTVSIASYLTRIIIR